MFMHARNGTVHLQDDTMHYICFGSGNKTLIMLPGLGDGQSSRCTKNGDMDCTRKQRISIRPSWTFSGKDESIRQSSAKYPNPAAFSFDYDILQPA